MLYTNVSEREGSAFMLETWPIKIWTKLALNIVIS